VTAEAAVVLPALVLVLAGGLGVFHALSVDLSATEAAQVGARAAARGDALPEVVRLTGQVAPPGSRVTVRRAGALVEVVVSSDVAPLGGGAGLLPRLTVSGRAVAAAEPGDAGSATVWVLGLAAVLLAVAMGVGVLGIAVLTRQRAAGVADLAALAAAADAARGSRSPCVLAAATASGAGVRLVGCDVRADGVVDVEVELSLPAGLSSFSPARVRARAGPRPAP
jgi:secretion/DNA translocation related TadE-like protein